MKKQQKAHEKHMKKQRKAYEKLMKKQRKTCEKCFTFEEISFSKSAEFMAEFQQLPAEIQPFFSAYSAIFCG